MGFLNRYRVEVRAQFWLLAKKKHTSSTAARLTERYTLSPVVNL